MNNPNRFTAVVLAVTLLVLVGCSRGSSTVNVRDPEETTVPTVDLAEAKQQTLGWTSMLMGAVPTELVAESWQHDDGVLMSCSEDSYQWSSAAEVTLDEEQDLVPMLERMAATWSDDEGFRTSFEKTGRGNPRLVVSGPGHAAIIIDARDDRRRLAISSFSTCVTDLADYDGGNTY